MGALCSTVSLPGSLAIMLAGLGVEEMTYSG
jgi:hypothetical protein